ncbi:MAG: hypothetical protein ACLQU1_21675 [Bryobacteraceae bacterium]
MQKLVHRLYRLLDKAEAREDDPSAIACHRELRRSVELLGRLTGELQAPAVSEAGGGLQVTIVYADKLTAAAREAIEVTAGAASLPAPEKVQ